LTASMGDFGVIAYGGMSEGASRFTGAKGSILDVDSANGDEVKGTSYGVELNAKMGKTMVAVSARQNDHDWNDAEVKSTSYGVWVSHEIAKNLTIQPEWVRSETKNTNDPHGTANGKS